MSGTICNRTFEPGKRTGAKVASVSLHKHPTLLPKDLGELTAYKRQGREAMGYERAQ
jgi:hypothetical protein